ncbi:MAG TPA: GGDEF domain-containing protein [Halomonas sp.]|nr:GGDEF domain-containing protein [Halomonas sp.]
MFTHLFAHQARWRLASFFALVLCTMSVIIGSYVYSTCQRAEADYTTLMSDIVLAQQATPQLQAAIKEGTRQPNDQQLEYIAYFISLSKQYLNGIQNTIEQHQFLSSGVKHLNNNFSELEERLIRLDRQVLAAQNRPELISPLQQEVTDVGENQAGLYNTLLNEVHTISQQQRLAVQRLSIAVSVLLVLVVSAAITLFMAVLHLHRQRNHMHQLMLTDELTGLYNRRHLVDVAFAALTQAKRSKAPLSLLLLDIDHFKRINDTYGHPVGDEVLRQISGRLRHLSRPSDTLARIGGEEFCLLMPNTSTLDALQAADRLRREIENMTLNGIAISSPTVSIGVTTGNGGAHTFEQLYSFADTALYQAKAHGRNRVESLLPPIAQSPEKAYAPQLIRQHSDL